MSKKELIQQLEKEQNSRLITYVTGDRPLFATRIAGDVVPLLSRHLEKIGRAKKIGLLLYTSGGDMLAPIRIVKLIRNHCDEFEVVVPYKAHSAERLLRWEQIKLLWGSLAN